LHALGICHDSALAPALSNLCVLVGVARDAGSDPPREAGILGLLQHGSGRVAVYGDSNCLDSSHQRTSCFEFLKPLLAWTAGVSGTDSKGSP